LSGKDIAIRIHTALKELYELSKISWEEVPDSNEREKRESEIRMLCYKQAMQVAEIAIKMTA
jgi:hypothetical protein